MRVACLCTIALMIPLSALPQRKPVKVQINVGVDTANHEIGAVVHLWQEYLNSRADSAHDNPLWLAAERERYTNFDLVNHTWFSPSLYGLMRAYKPTVLSVSQISGGFKIRTLFSYPSDSGFANVLAITELAAKKEDGVYKLGNMLTDNTAGWGHETVGSITFHFPPGHTFNTPLAEHMNKFVDSIRTLWKMEPIPVDYYFAGTVDSVYKAIGIDYVMTSGNIPRPGGYTQIQNHLVFAGGSNEWYPHEFVHIYINPRFPGANPYFSEGYAALLGGSRGHDLDWHIRRTNSYLQDHPGADLLSLNNIDFATGTVYVVGGLICRMADEKGGLDLLRKLFGYGGEEQDFYRAMKDVFGVEQNKLNQFLRDKISEYAR